MPTKQTTCPNCGALVDHVCPDCLYRNGGSLREEEAPQDDSFTRMTRHIGARIAEGFNLIAAAGDA